ncbi:MAG: 2-C-methyl-D-erythritol 4-phosphate cytidylyltransferase [Bacteroidaceae bacterium]|nr:2-C-methyl-D-erythritol 4-phosphate cytidylyltransferase [Bacteroidaceae bacterium]
MAAIEAYINDDDNIMIHDAVRPMVSKRIIRDCVEALGKYDAVDVAVPATDTILQVVVNGLICNIPPRKMLRIVQTPQCFKRRVIAEAYKRGLADPEFVTTDDCGVVHRYMPEVPIFIVDGESTNIKITFKEDIKTFESYLNR